MRIFTGIILAGCLAMGLIGCEKISAPYVMKMDRVDQVVTDGNRGYLEGTPTPADDRSNLKRPFIAIDVDMIEDASN